MSIEKKTQTVSIKLYQEHVFTTVVYIANFQPYRQSIVLFNSLKQLKTIIVTHNNNYNNSFTMMKTAQNQCLLDDY